MTETVTITGGPMQLVSFDPGSSGGNYSLQGINMILGGPAWTLTFDSSNPNCLGLLPGGEQVMGGPVDPNICHVGAISSLRPIGAPCAGCFNLDFFSDGRFTRSEQVSYADLPDLHLWQHGVPEPSGLALLSLGLAALWIRKR